MTGRRRFPPEDWDMSESSSGVNTLSGSFPKSHWSQCSGQTHSRLSVEPSPDSGLTTTPLPSRRFRFASWHGLDQCDVTGDQLSCPRVRAGPCEGVGGAVALEPWTRTRGRPGPGQPWEQRLQENWENCRELNLSFQDLGDPYQQENFLRILRRLIRVEQLQLVNNSLTSLSSVRLPSCQSFRPSSTSASPRTPSAPWLGWGSWAAARCAPSAWPTTRWPSLRTTAPEYSLLCQSWSSWMGFPNCPRTHCPPARASHSSPESAAFCSEGGRRTRSLRPLGCVSIPLE
ncbi:uncharacterized protein LOC128763405 isoform X2 [Synchiropus splendidus]|uniref:uncharacterized protein LOC128763405 isoform X2 n=1 Tax=Synchiropus splendidus TaxID=270530 RepID=UPI00237E5427|nr:uncharacterized protein LOC128763405 isoform X2 [Synchiropus splendidus]